MTRDKTATVYEQSVPGRHGLDLPQPDVPLAELPVDLRDDCGLPELSQLDLARHYTALSRRNFGVDTGFYPLGSCTMKFNPKVNEVIARLPGFAESHPLQDPEAVPGNLAVMFWLQQWLAEIGGFAAVSLQPAAGAHGEFTGLLMMRAFHLARGDTRRTRILIPDSAHGTNPASSTMAGFSAVELPSDARGNIDLDAVRAAADDTCAGIMMTNPNTLGLFEEQIGEVVRLVHDCGGLVYGDGANLNAVAGIVRPGDLGVDVMHFNLHKTFSTPHGGGGPGSGPVGVSARLKDFLPGPVVARAGEGEAARYAFVMPAQSIGRVSTYCGNFGMFVRAYAYIRQHGAAGLRENSEHAVLNANYMRVKLRDAYRVPYDRINMHEFVCQGAIADTGVRALDVSKRLLDHGFHPPTNYFPLIVPEALMIEPTETEAKPTLDAFIAAMRTIAEEAKREPALVKEAPHATPVRRVDEVKAARELILSDRTEIAAPPAAAKVSAPPPASEPRPAPELRRTPLHDLHVRLGARMVPFAGYAMPVQYPTGILKEHQHTRAAAGLFDVSHMGQVALRGRSGSVEDAARALERLVPGDMLGLAAWRQRYTLLTNPAGGVLDDLMVSRHDDRLMLVVNAARKDFDAAHLREHLADACEIEPLADRALIALQGPAAEGVLTKFAPDVAEMRFMDTWVLTIHGADGFVTRSGYTGEDGFEISVPAAAAVALCEALLADPAVAPVGLGARDSLRLEAGLCLYGADLDETTTPVEAALEWTLPKARRADGPRAGGFPGADVVLGQLAHGASRRRVGLKPEGRAPVRGGAPLFASESASEPIGTATSGGFGVSLKAPVAMGYVRRDLASPGTRLFAEVRGKRLAVSVVDMPFWPTRYRR
jgi:glycine cleavage system P protein (glycine dehydrogenase) subunit 2